MVNNDINSLNVIVFANLYADLRKRILGEFLFIENDNENAALDKLKELPEPKFLKLIGKISEKSREFAQFLLKGHDEPFTPEDIVDFLNKTDIPCLSSGWKLLDDNSTFRRFRTHCPGTVCSHKCTYLRESVKGLVEGLSTNVKYSRHRSIGHGDKMCIDLIYNSDDSDQKFGIIPDEIDELIKPVGEKLEEYYFRLITDGYSEGILYYRLINKKTTFDTLNFNLAKEVLQQTFLEKLPHVRLIETNTINTL